jgi:hypothetical protein
MNNFKRRSLRPLPLSLLLGLILSLTQGASTVKAQTPESIRQKIRELEKTQQDLNDDIAFDRELVSLLDSNKFLLVGFYPVSKEYVEKRLRLESCSGR